MTINNSEKAAFAKLCRKRKKNAGNQHFLLFLQCFQQSSISRSLKVVIVWETVYSLSHDIILDLSKLEAFADDKIKCRSNRKFEFALWENIVVRNIFSCFPTMLSTLPRPNAVFCACKCFQF